MDYSYVETLPVIPARIVHLKPITDWSDEQLEQQWDMHVTRLVRFEQMDREHCEAWNLPYSECGLTREARGRVERIEAEMARRASFTTSPAFSLN